MTSSPPPAPHELYSYSPPLSVWSLVETYVAQHEWHEVRHLLGESLVDQSLELQQEVQTLLEIWRDFRNETDNQPMYHRLPEPPDVRDRLKKEISFFVQSIREKSSQNGRNLNQVLSKHNKEVLDYVLMEEKKLGTSCSSRPSTARSSQDGRETPLAVHTPDRLCQSSFVSGEMEAMQDKLDFLKLDEVIQHLRETILHEIQWLTKDIEFLQGCLEEEANFRSTSRLSREPTLSDLKEERSKLEKELLSESPNVPEALRRNSSTELRSPSFTGKSPITPSPPKTKNQNNSIGVRSAPIKGSTPIKACHQVSTQVLTLPDTKKTSPENVSRNQRSQPQSVQGGDSLSTMRHKAIADNSASHVTIRMTNGQLSALSASSSQTMAPTPPKSVRPVRPGSAQKFRKMVMQCRDDT